MTDKWKGYTAAQLQKPAVRKAKNSCQMMECTAYIKYKCVPPEVFVVATPATIYVCERHMPHWRDKNYHISSASRIP